MPQQSEDQSTATFEMKPNTRIWTISINEKEYQIKVSFLVNQITVKDDPWLLASIFE